MFSEGTSNAFKGWTYGVTVGTALALAVMIVVFVAKLSGWLALALVVVMVTSGIGAFIGFIEDSSYENE